MVIGSDGGEVEQYRVLFFLIEYLSLLPLNWNVSQPWIIYKVKDGEEQFIQGVSSALEHKVVYKSWGLEAGSNKRRLQKKRESHDTYLPNWKL